MSISKLATVQLRLLDPYVPLFYARIDLIVPSPTPTAPNACILVSVRQGHRKLFFRASLADVRRHFRLTVAQRLALADALSQAKAIVAELQEAERQELLGRTLPELPATDDPT